MDIKKAIRQAIEDSGLKHVFIATKLNMSKSYFSQVLAKEDLKINEAVKIADVIGYDVKMQLISRDSGKIIDVD